MQPFRAAPYYLTYLIPAMTAAGCFLGGAWTFLTPVFVFGVGSALDGALGRSDPVVSEEDLRNIADSPRFRAVTYAYVPIQFALVMGGAYVVSHRAVTPLEWAGFALSTGLTTGAMGITIAHELCHRTSRLERILAKLLLLPVCYMHFVIEHVKGHHRRVATPRDPATARRGESFYAFYLRSVAGGFLSAWGIEARRLRKAGRSAWSAGNAAIWSVVLPAAFAAFLAAIFSAKAAVYFFVQSVVAFTLLEIVNYLEHYGLERKRLPSGRYEPVAFEHSWNSNFPISNLLFRLPFHSDHHYRPWRRYQILRNVEGAPQLPAGYPGMMLLALLPPLWRKVMDPRVEEARQRRAQISTGR